MNLEEVRCGIWTGLICLNGKVVGSYECSNELSGPRKCREFLD
jgi:hypothetical protein